MGFNSAFKGLIINKVVYRLNLYLFYLLVYLRLKHFLPKTNPFLPENFQNYWFNMPIFTCLHLFWLSSELDL